MNKRFFCFLQGPVSHFYNELANRLEEKGHCVLRITFCKGDELFWRHSITSFKDKLENFSKFFIDFLQKNTITDIVLIHDCRPHHKIALAISKEKHIKTWIIEQGYLRPHYITIETSGFSANSPIPKYINFFINYRGKDYHRNTCKTSNGKNSLLECLINDWPCFKLYPVFCYILYDTLTYIFSFKYKHYQFHRVNKPFIQYLYIIKRIVKNTYTLIRTRITERTLFSNPQKSYFFFPLQISDDFQIREHSSFKDMPDAIRTVLLSFANHSNKCLLIKAHPLDPLIINYRKFISLLSRSLNIQDRVFYVGSGHTPTFIRNSSGVVTVNSTVGLQAISHGLPTIALGKAIYNMEGLTYQGTLDDFWINSSNHIPHHDGYIKFKKYLLDHNQVEGEFFKYKWMKIGAENCANFIQSNL